MDTIAHWLTELAHAVDLVGIVILLYAAVLAIAGFTRAEVARFTGRVFDSDQVRCDLGGRILFALELMIASDIIQTVVSRTMDDLIFLGILVVIRWVISFFLGRELQEIRHKAEGAPT